MTDVQQRDVGDLVHPTTGEPHQSGRRLLVRRRTAASLAVFGVLAAVLVVAVTYVSSGSSYPVGTPDASEPSGMSPPAATALPGYSLIYETTFPGTSLPTGWSPYVGEPGGDPGAEWATNHVQVGGDLLRLSAFKDPADNDEWVTGGVGQFGLHQTYGAYFVRSRVTGAGPTGVELLWPADNSWPPEIDFNETTGVIDTTTATVHWSSTNQQDKRSLKIDMTQWHTWGVIWTPSSVTYTVDGRAWGTVNVPSEIPQQAMRLALQQQTWCSSGFACPSSPQSMEINWVAEYAPG